MPDGAKRGWNQIFGDAGSRVEEDLRSLVQYINDEVVPEVRRNGPDVLRRTAAELEKLADRMENRAPNQSSQGEAKP